ncbi:glycosyltransferase [Lactiplantibacillus sp. DA1]|uniref:glycosyltransferase n=1 Tax=Lactiplantibacillus sp. DA1 TaxID=3079857 RepID=UPI00292A62EA|nr:glycosyltransferase [Lactiplantibacillus sp. DA1]MDV0430142.1 glycosyltransferase [Lactiplantibacillus sp. DA1]
MTKSKLKPIKVGIVVGKMVGGGVEAMLLNFLECCDLDKFAVDFIIDADSTSVPVQVIRQLGGQIHYVPPYQDVICYQTVLIRLFKRERYQIVHANISALNVFPMFAAFVSRVPVRIAHNHNLIAANDGFKKNTLKRVLAPWNTLFPTIYVAPTVQSGRWIFKRHPFEVVKNGIDSQRFKFSEVIRRDIRTTLQIKDSQILIGSFTRFVNCKRLFFALDVIEKLVLKNPNFRFLLIGDGPLKNKLKTHVAANPILQTAVTILSSQHQIEKYYSALDCYLFPSSVEAFGMTAVEAQVNGLQTFVSAGIPTEARISTTLFKVVADYQVEHWCEQIMANTKVMNNRGLLSNQMVAHNHLSSQQMAGQLEHIYQQAIKRRL